MSSSRSRISQDSAHIPETVYDLRERLAEVLHDLHTPLAALSLLAIPDDPSSVQEDDSRRQLRRAVTALRRQTLILRDHPIFRSAPMVLSRMHIDVASWLHELHPRLEELARSRGIDLEWLPADANGSYLFDAQRLEGAIEHLFMYRARRSARPGRVRVRCSSSKTGFEIGIAGIEAPDPDPLSPRNRFSAGVEFADAVIASHGGTLLDSDSDNGWREWIIRIPNMAGTDSCFPNAPADAEDALRRVLVVEDDQALRELLVDLLSIRFQVDSSPDASAAILSARANPPDLLVADQGLPDSLGTDLALSIRAETGRAIPLLLVTGYAVEEVLPQVDRMRILLKPFRGTELLAQSSELLHEFADS